MGGFTLAELIQGDIFPMAMAKLNSPTIVCTRGIGKWDKCMAKENFNGVMDLLMRETIYSEESMGRVSLCLALETSTRGTGLMENSMAREFCLIRNRNR